MKIKFRIFFALILASIFIFLIIEGVVPTGHIKYDLFYPEESRSNFFIGKPTPAERIDSTSSEFDLIGEPVYITLSTPRRFNKAVLKIKFNNQNDMPVIEAGIMTDKITKTYDLKPVENRIIDRLSYVWDKTQEGEIIFLQKDRKYNDIKSFLNDLPPRNEIGVYNYELPGKFILKDYKPESYERTISHSFRGPYQFYTYIKNEKLDFSFDITDLNQNKDPDNIEINLYHEGALIDSRKLEDDGIETDNGQESPERGIMLSDSGLPEGVYKIEVKCNNDIITDKIKTTQSRISFLNRLWIVDKNFDKNSTLYTDSLVLSAQTENPGSLQEISIDGKKFGIKETYRQYSEQTERPTASVKLEKSDIIISGNGLFGFDDKMFFDPELKKVSGNIDPEKSGIKYIIANYSPPLTIDGWREATVFLDLERSYRELIPSLIGDPGKYSLIISVPGLRADDNVNDRITIQNIDIDLYGTNLADKINKIYKIFSKKSDD